MEAQQEKDQGQTRKCYNYFPLDGEITDFYFSFRVFQWFQSSLIILGTRKVHIRKTHIFIVIAKIYFKSSVLFLFPGTLIYLGSVSTLVIIVEGF